MLIGLSGYAQSGKDTLAAELVRSHGFTRVAFADKLRELALESCGHLYVMAGRAWPLTLQQAVGDRGWEGAKKIPAVRHLLQNLGTGVRNHIDSDAWVKAALAGRSPDENIVVTDMRFPNEFHAISDMGGICVRVTRPGVDAFNRHVSETAIDHYHFDAHIHNDGSLADLCAPAEWLVAKFA